MVDIVKQLLILSCLFKRYSFYINTISNHSQRLQIFQYSRSTKTKFTRTSSFSSYYYNITFIVSDNDILILCLFHLLDVLFVPDNMEDSNHIEILIDTASMLKLCLNISFNGIGV